MENEEIICACCKKKVDEYFEIEFKELCETHQFCKECFKDIYAEATGWNLVNF